MRLLSSFTHFQVVSNLYEFLLNSKEDIEECIFIHTKSNILFVFSRRKKNSHRCDIT